MTRKKKEPTVWWDNSQKIYPRHNQRFLYNTKRNQKRALTPIADGTTNITDTKEQRPNQD